MRILKDFILDDDVLNIYVHGSHVYGTATEHSDIDYILVVNDLNKFIEENKQQKIGNDDYNFVSKDNWIKQADINSIDFIECHFLPANLIIKETFKPDFKLDPIKIRNYFSKHASNSWAKAYKKLTVEKDFAPYIGKKSLWHSLRIYMFGINLLETGKLDYTLANHLFDDIVNNDRVDWQYFKDKYQPLRNELKSKFKELQNVK